MPTVAISIVNHGMASPTLKCVESLLTEARRAEGRFELAVWVADNGSAAPERQALQAALAGRSGVMLRDHAHNLGFAAGHNRNIEAILAASRPDFIWLLNNDCMVKPGCVDALLTCAYEYPGVGIWGATLLEIDDATIQCAGGCFYNSWMSSYRQYGQGRAASKRDRLGAVKFDYISGASLFFPASTVASGLTPPAKLPSEDTGECPEYLNESFFLYFEELDLARRLEPGLTLGWCRDALITHVGGESTGTGGNQRSAQAEYHSTLSALKFTRLYFPRRLWIMAPARYVAKSLQLLLAGKPTLMGTVSAAYRDFWKWLRGHDA